MKNNQTRGFLSKLIASYFEKQQENETEAPDFEGEKVYQNVLGTIREREYRIIRLKRNLRIAAAVTLLAGGSAVAWYYSSGTNGQLQQTATMERSAAKGQTVFLELPDGTKVWLNADSKLSYSGGAKETGRKVTLSGEAYFEVAPHPGKPFVIHTGNLRTEVLGTSFNVKAYPDNNKAEVTVLTGKVAVTAPGHKTVHVVPGQKVVFNKSGMDLEAQEVNASASIGWKSGKMIYRGAEVREVLADIERKYNTKVIYTKEIGSCTITADFQNEAPGKVLAVLAKLINGKISKKEGNYYLEGDGCE